MGIPLKRGRDFRDADSKAAPVVIVSERLAHRQWPDRDPIGQRIRIDPFLPGEPWRTVVGVVGDVRAEGARKEPPPAIYVPESFDPRPVVAVVLNTDLPPATLMQAARQVMRRLDPELPLYGARPVAAVIAEAMWQFRFFTFLLSAFACVAVLLATIGLGGIVASMVVERTQEIGIRLAIGATARDIVRLVLSRAFVLAGTGAAIGIVVALVTTDALSGQLFEIKPHDGLTFIAVLLVLLCAALVAAWLPARRAARVDPACALRWE
jgi:putative ABC transport system permease protein